MSLAYMKREKNFRAVIDKNYSRNPESEFDYTFLIDLVYEELDELIESLCKMMTFKIKNGITNEFEHYIVKYECADVSNIIDYIFEKSERRHTK